jgi:hypothetical protein
MCCFLRSQPAHRSQPVFQLAVIGFDRIIGIPFDVVPRLRNQLIQHAAGPAGHVNSSDNSLRGALPGSTFLTPNRVLDGDPYYVTPVW